MKRVLVTGVRGFIGRHLVAELAGSFSLVGVDLADGVDLTDPASLDALEGDFEAVIHLAGLSFVPASFERPAEFHRVNFNGTLTVAEFCRRRAVRVLVYPNTYVYGQPQRLPVNEEHPIALPSPYHRSKKLAEDLLLGYFGGDETRVVALRVFNLYGPQQDPRFLLPQLLREARASGRVTVRDLESRRDFLYIKDFVRLVRAIVDAEQAAAGIYNVGSGRSHSVAEAIQILGELLRRPVQVNNLQQRRPNEIMDCYADTTKVSQAFGWAPEYSLRDGLTHWLARDPGVCGLSLQSETYV